MAIDILETHCCDSSETDELGQTFVARLGFYFFSLPRIKTGTILILRQDGLRERKLGEKRGPLLV